MHGSHVPFSIAALELKAATNLSGPASEDGGAEAERRPGHVHGPGEGQEPADGEGRQDVPGPDRGPDQVHAAALRLQSALRAHELLLDER